MLAGFHFEARIVDNAIINAHLPCGDQPLESGAAYRGVKVRQDAVKAAFLNGDKAQGFFRHDLHLVEICGEAPCLQCSPGFLYSL
jgi:hypothetical protein